MDRSPLRGIGVAWDNFDRYVETGGGESTLHDTVEIAYQANINQSINSDNQMSGSSSSTHRFKYHTEPTAKHKLHARVF